MSAKDLAVWLGIVIAMAGPFVAYGRLQERQEKNDITLAEHEHKINGMLQDNRLLERIHELELRIGEMTAELKELRDETRRRTR